LRELTGKVVALGEKDQNKNNVVYRTETQYSTLFPYWNREFRIDFDGAEDLIVVDVWDWDAGKQDDWIGRALMCS
jgi:Ca2+-dependent lipid-binding protein